MDTEMSSEVSDSVMEKEVALKVATPDEATQPENPAAAEEEPGQPTVNGHSSDGPETENVTPPEEKPEAKDDDSSAKEAHESSEKISDPVETPENTTQPPPVPENEPEPLAESSPEPQPEKSAESVPEAEPREQTSPEPAAVQQPVDSQPPSQEDAEKGPETTMEPKNEVVAEQKEAEVATEKKEAEVAAEPKSEVAPEPKVAAEATEPKSEVAAEPKETGEAAGTVLVTEPAIVKVEEPEQKDKPAEEEVKAEDKGAEAAAEPEQEEDPTPASGSLAFALLEQQQTKDALRISRTLVVLRGLPGSGKTFLARAIGDAYQDHCCVISADDHGIKPESPSADGYKALDDAVVARCSDAATASSSVLIVVDDTNHTQDRLARLGEIGEQNHLVTIFLQTQTQWSRDVPALSKKSKRGLQEAQLEAMKAPLEEVDLPLFFGWFLLSSVQEKVRCTSMDFLKTLDTLEAFKKHLVDFTGKAEKEVDLEQYFKPKGALHCTTKFCDYGKAEGAKEYAENPAVKSLYGSAFELSLTALFVTPRTVGARVSLTEEQLQLWPTDSEQSSSSAAAASLPPGSRAHITLGCAEGVEPVQTGLDLLDILALQQDGQQGEPAEEMELGSLSYYGEGRWLLSLREPIGAPACFSSFYGRKESEPAKKEAEKKKKPKCAIL